MTLDADDVNGFRQSTAGKKANAGGKKGKGKKNAAKKEDPALAFTGVAYDPARPCDYVRVCLPTRARRRSARRRLPGRGRPCLQLRS